MFALAIPGSFSNRGQPAASQRLIGCDSVVAVEPVYTLDAVVVTTAPVIDRQRRLSERKKDELDLIRLAEAYPRLKSLYPTELQDQIQRG